MFTDSLSSALKEFERAGGVVAVKNVMAVAGDAPICGVKLYLFIPDGQIRVERNENGFAFCVVAERTEE